MRWLSFGLRTFRCSGFGLGLTYGVNSWLPNPEYLVINFTDSPPPVVQGTLKSLWGSEATTDRDAIIGRGSIGQDGFAFVAPAAKNAFDATQPAVILNQFLRVRQRTRPPAF